MFKNKRILAVITARGGSKTIPNKNIKIFAGKPLIHWVIKAAGASRYVDKVIVSTDSKKIQTVALKSKADVPFLRPAFLATDTAPSIGAVLHAVDELKSQGQEYDIVVLLQPTSPLVTGFDIDKAIEELMHKNAHVIVSVSLARVHPLWMNTLPKNKSMKKFISGRIAKLNRQRLPCYYQTNGALKLGYIDYLRKKNNFYTPQTFAYVMPQERSVDIDDMLDFMLAEQVFKLSKSRK